MATDSAEKIVNRIAFVASGSFNPAILHPDWFSRHSILPSEEIAVLLAEPIRKDIPELGATIEFGKHFIVEPARAILGFKSFRLTAEREKFQVLTERRDTLSLMIAAVKKIFLILPETPVASYGINVVEHIQFEESARDVINKFFGATEGMKSFFGSDLEFGHKIISSRDKGAIIFQIEPSLRVENAVYLHINFHFDNPQFNINNEFITKDLSENVERSLDFSEKLITSFCGKFAKRFAGVNQ